MADTTPTQPTIPNVEQAAAQATQAVNQVTDQVQAQAQQIADTAKQLAADPTKAVGMVTDQIGNLSNAVGAKELLQDTAWWAMPMKDFVIHTLKMAFFLDPQQRSSRGEFVVGGLASFIVLSIITAILPILLGGVGLFISMVVSMIPVLNLGIKRFHDMKKPARWAIMVLIPVFWRIMPALFKGENENNPYWPDPVLKAPADSQGYIIIILSLFIVSSMVTTIMWFIGVNVSGPSADSVTNTSSSQSTTKLPTTKSNTLNPTTKTTQKITQ